MGHYLTNMETLKLELHFEKEEYIALSDEQKSNIKSNFLFSRRSGAWVSRCKFPNLYCAESVAKKLGLENKGKKGETLTFAEQMGRKAERAEARADRYDAKSAQAIKNASALQKPINDMHGDIAFFTQPNINSSSGRAFSRRRDRMWASWERGWDEYKKSEHYAECAAIARQTAEQTKPTDKGFCDRRIKDAEKTIRAQKKNIDYYNKLLTQLENGEEIKRYNGDLLTVETVNEWLEHSDLIVKQAMSKLIYYKDCIESLGGVQFSKNNIKPGYIVYISRWGECEVISAGRVNIRYKILHGGAAGFDGVAAYAEIEKIVSENTPDMPMHPFKVGDVYKVWRYNEFTFKREQVEYTITKVTPEKVTLKCGSERAISRKPRWFMNSQNRKEWAIGVVNGNGGTVYQVAT